MTRQPTVIPGKYGLLLRYAAPGWRGWGLIAGMMLLTSLFGLLQPWPMKVVVDHVLGREPLPGLLAAIVRLLPTGGTPRGLLFWMALAGVAIFAANSAADIILARAWVRVGQKMVYRLAGDLFAHVQRRSLLFHSRNSVGDSLSRITGDSWCVYRVVDALLFTPAYALVLTTGMVVVMGSMDCGLTLLALAVAPLMAGTSFALGRPIRRAARVRREIEARIQAHVQRSLSGVQVVQAFAQEDRELERFRACTHSALESQRRLTLATALYNLASGLVLALGTGCVLWVGARHVLAGRLSVGGLVVFLTYLTLLQGQMKTLAGIYSTLQEVGASIDRVLEVLEGEREVVDRPGAAALPAVKGHVRLEGVTFGYEPGWPVLRDVSLEVLPGQVVAVVGATGAGKTTLVSLVARFFDPWEGRVTIDGQDLRDLQVKSLREQVGLVLQEPFLFPFTIAENIAYGRPGASRTEVEAAARAANAHAFIERLPGGYEAVVGERGVTLSGGERQRLAVARALLKNAPVLVLDEPTSALDAHTEKLLLEALRRLMKGRTTFIIAHRLSTVRDADLIVVLEEGRVVEVGTHEELLERGGVYTRLYRTQTGPRPESVCKAG